MKLAIFPATFVLFVSAGVLFDGAFSLWVSSNSVIIEDVFKFENLTYNFQNAETLDRSNVNSAYRGSETITSLGAKIWKFLPKDYKELTSFKFKMSNWETD